MRIAIMGSGGLGGYFGARLAHGGADVHFIARGEHLQAMRATACASRGPSRCTSPASTRPTSRPRSASADVVMVCVKLWDTESALEQIRPMVGPAHGHLVPERRAEGPGPQGRLSARAHHGRRGLRRHDHRPAGRHPPDRAHAAAAVRRVRRLALGARRSPPRGLPRGRHQRRAVGAHPARDLAEVRVPGRAVGHDDHDAPDDRPHPRESRRRARSSST